MSPNTRSVLCGLEDLQACASVCAVARSIGARVTLARDGRAVVAGLKNNRPCVAFVELRYDDIDIFEILALLRDIQQDAETPRCSIVLVNQSRHSPDKPDYAKLATLQGADTINGPPSHHDILKVLTTRPRF